MSLECIGWLVDILIFHIFILILKHLLFHSFFIVYISIAHRMVKSEPVSSRNQRRIGLSRGIIALVLPASILVEAHIRAISQMLLL